MSDGPVLPEKDPGGKILQRSVGLRQRVWDALSEIAKASGYSRNEVIALFLQNRIDAWQRERSAALAEGTPEGRKPSGS